MIELRQLDELFTYRDRTFSAYEIASYFIILVSLFFFVFPVYWMFISSIKPASAINDFPPQFIPVEVTLNPWRQLLFGTNYLVWLRNSLIITVSDVVISTLVSVFAGYALTRYNIPIKKWLARIFIFGYMFPKIMLGVPYYTLFQELGLTNTLVSVIIAHQAVILPFTTWLMWQFFQTVSISQEEAAWVYGASRLRGILEVALPSALPGIVAVAIFAFAVGWSDYTFALLLTSTPNVQPLTVGITSFLTAQEIYWGNLMAASAGLTLPPLIVVLFLNKYILAGFTVRSE